MASRPRKSPLLRRLVPRRLRETRWRVKAKLERRYFSELTLGETFERIYAERRWGPREFDSGEGSETEWSEPYIQVVREFIRSRGVRSVADLGCGDFRVGNLLLEPGFTYTGVDIVPELIERNRQMFESADVTFECRNLIDDELPSAELALVRQVLQHLSNAEIEMVLKKVRSYRYVIVTEHLPTGDDVVPNVDKAHGPGTRMPDKSGVFLDAPPFSLDVSDMLVIPFMQDQVIRTVLIENGDQRQQGP